MKKDEVIARIKEIAIVPAIRVSSGDDAHFAAEAVTHAGIPIVEITMTVPGAMTPTEVVTAWKAGADFVKVFPCAQIGGDKYIKASHASLPQIPFDCGRGRQSTDCGQFHLVGATAIGIGTELIPTEAIERRQSDRIRELARRFRKLVKDARDEIAAWERSVVVKKYTGTEKCEK